MRWLRIRKFWGSYGGIASYCSKNWAHLKTQQTYNALENRSSPIAELIARALASTSSIEAFGATRSLIAAPTGTMRYHQKHFTMSSKLALFLGLVLYSPGYCYNNDPDLAGKRFSASRNEPIAAAIRTSRKGRRGLLEVLSHLEGVGRLSTTCLLRQSPFWLFKAAALLVYDMDDLPQLYKPGNLHYGCQTRVHATERSGELWNAINDKRPNNTGSKFRMAAALLRFTRSLRD